MLKEIPIYEIEHVKIGNAQDTEAKTGCTVLLFPQGAPAGIDVRGGGPASRESELLNPVAACEAIHAIVLSGGSAFGLDAAGGVMEYLEKQNIGFSVGDIRVPLVCQSCIFDLSYGRSDISAFGLDAAGGVMEYLEKQNIGFSVGDIRVPLVCQSCIFDLSYGRSDIRPDKNMAYQACMDAETNRPQSGNYGCGCGATVGKMRGMEYAQKSGLGIYAVSLGDLKVGAVVCVNALGDVYDHRNGQRIAGMRLPDSCSDSEEFMYQMYANAFPSSLPSGNTTIGVILTNAAFDKTHMNKIAAMAQDAYARCIHPIHTTADGDTVYAVSTGTVCADINLVGTLSAHVMAEAIRRAVTI